MQFARDFQLTRRKFFASVFCLHSWKHTDSISLLCVTSYVWRAFVVRFIIGAPVKSCFCGECWCGKIRMEYPQGRAKIFCVILLYLCHYLVQKKEIAFFINSVNPSDVGIHLGCQGRSVLTVYNEFYFSVRLTLTFEVSRRIFKDHCEQPLTRNMQTPRRTICTFRLAEVRKSTAPNQNKFISNE